MKKIVVIVSLIWGLAYAGDVDFEEVYKAYKNHDYITAFKGFKILADKEDDYDAAYILGYMYEHGEGVEANKTEAIRYYKKAANGFYYQRKEDPSVEVKKEQRNILKSLDGIEDRETLYTIKQFAQSLYNIKAYDTNYFLPVSYLYSGEYRPFSPSLQSTHELKSTEVEFQFSVKYDFATNTLGMHEIYSFAYTQRSFWHAYAYSAYFRESNYNPEFFVTIPFQFKYIKAIRGNVAHQSNGRGGTQERSWNYAAASVFFQTGYLFTELKLWKRIDTGIDYNPELIDYMGHGHLRFMLPFKKHLFTLKVRSNFHGASAFEYSYSYPFFGSKDLFFYMKGFNGYGESLIDFDNKVSKIGMGFSISR